LSGKAGNSTAYDIPTGWGRSENPAFGRTIGCASGAGSAIKSDGSSCFPWVKEQNRLMRKIRLLGMGAVLAFGIVGGVFEKAEAAPATPYRPVPYKSPARPSTPAKPAVTTIRYSGSAQAANMIMPAIWMGLPPLVILALIIRAFSKD